MPTVVVTPELYRRVEQVSLEQKTSVDEILAQAIRHYLWDTDRRRISEESQFYRQQHADLKTHFLGQYIAMHSGRVVDHDTDLQTLRRRVHERFGRTPVMITLVEDLADPALVRRGFREGATDS